jgi:peptidoglycan/xylan/chitin deacetylase (PgdA/CDA1 family)
MYHSVDDGGSVVSTSRDAFARQMQWLHDQAFNIMPLSSLAQCLVDREPLPARSAVITFDDGFENVYSAAFPILAKHGFCATVFLVTGFCGKNNDWPGQPSIVPRLPLLTWPQVREMSRLNIAFGSHTITHPRLDRISSLDAEREIVESRTEIEQQLGQSAPVFAHPYGRSSRSSLDLVRRSYRAAAGTHLGMVKSASDVFEIERVEAYYVQRLTLFRLLGGPWCSPYLGIRHSIRTVASKIAPRAWE